jgi:hypothetical protein
MAFIINKEEIRGATIRGYALLGSPLQRTTHAHKGAVGKALDRLFIF